MQTMMEWLLAAYDWSHMFSVNLTVAMWSAFSEILYNAIDIFVPTYTPARHKCRKLYSKKCRKVMARKRCL